MKFLDGGYQAARLSLLRYLESRGGRSGSVIIIREVLPEYYVTVGGNWHIRESMSHVFQNMVARGGRARRRQSRPSSSTTCPAY